MTVHHRRREKFDLRGLGHRFTPDGDFRRC